MDEKNRLAAGAPSAGKESGAVPQHTPGPWSFTPSVPEEGYECFWITATPAPNQERELATVSGPQNARNTANARLITAAPDLLEALKDARNYVDAVVANSGDTKRRANYRGCVARIDAAIAKATQASQPGGEANPHSGATP